jgi:hypothetical protein
MPIKKYLDIDSTYRDRTLYPNPALFAVEDLNINNIFVDPVSKASMIYPTPTYTNTYAYPLSNPSANVLSVESVYLTDSIFPINIPLAQTDNIFINKVLEIINDDPEVNAGELTTSYANINQVVYQGTNTFLVETGSVYAAVDTSVILSTPPNDLVSFYLAPTSSDIDNYYVNKTIKINSETRTILAYDGGRRLVTVNLALSSAPVALDTFEIYGIGEWSLVTDESIVTTPTLQYPSHRIHNYPVFTRNLYRIRDDIPVFTGTVIGGNNSLNTVQFPFSASSATDFYKGNWVWFNSPDRLIYTGTVDNVIFGLQTRWTINDLFVSPAVPIGVLDVGMAIVIKTSWGGTDYLLVSSIDSVVSTTQLTMLYGFPETIQFGDSVWIYATNPILNQYRQITAYNGATRVATLGGPLPSEPLAGDTFDILKINYNNYNRLNVVQSGVNTNQPVCYELELQCLTLPNLILSTGTGNRIAFYPYVYVEFSSLTAKTYTNALQTNVPNISNVVFKVPVYAVNTPTSSTFVVLDGRGMTQTLKFKANDSFLVRILLPNGELFTTSQVDSSPPVIPLPAVQISLTFGVKRLV